MKLFKSHLRGHQASKPKAATRKQRLKGQKFQTEHFSQTLLFEKSGIASSDGQTYLRVPYAEGEAGASLAGVQLEAGAARELVKALPKGKLDGPITVTRVLDELMLDDAQGKRHKAPIHKGQSFPEIRGIPQHGQYHETVVDGEAFLKLTRNAVKAEKDLIGPRLKGQPKQVVYLKLRMSKSPDHPVELHGKRGVFGFIMSCVEKVKDAISRTANVSSASTRTASGKTYDNTGKIVKPELVEAAK